VATLKEQLLTDGVRPALVRECAELVDQEVSHRGGLSGLAVKGAYKTVKALRPGFVPGVINGLLDEWVAELEPFWESFGARANGASFERFLEDKRDEVAEHLLRVTDRRARVSVHKTAAKLYERLRSSAKQNVAAAVPGLARVVRRHLVA
jgi:hypothetical protein